ncbi:MAG TPA: hypothetical protein PKE12_02830 [Kiritimatiellia bacterium]|nr:hypothetical protein [Kiritimatiellia bacterium]
MPSLAREIQDRLRRLPDALGLAPSHIPGGISSLGCAADEVFTSACAELRWPQRFFLPTDAGLDSAWMAAPHVIQARVLNECAEVDDRLEDVDLEILRVCDVLLVLVDAERADASPSPVIARARVRRKPRLEIRLEHSPGGEPRWRADWCDRDEFSVPTLPGELDGLPGLPPGCPSAGDLAQHLLGTANRQAMATQRFFRCSALVVIGAHVAATLCAVLALKLHGEIQGAILGLEIALLAAGLAAHHWVHHAQATRRWSMARLVAEIGRSVGALHGVAAYLSHLFTLPFPESVRPVTRTLRVLHLRDTYRMRCDDWRARRDAYLEDRITNSNSGQLAYYGLHADRAARRLKLARRVFLSGSLLALCAAAGKWVLYAGTHTQGSAWLPGVLGALAILMPVLSVAALSLAASFDLEARMHTYREMMAFLRRQERYLRDAASEREFTALALETEFRLLGETASWYTRRFFTGVN